MRLFYDEAGIALDPTIAAQWAPKGKQPLFPSSSRKERVNLGGIVNPQTGDAFVQRIKKGDSVSFIGILEWLHGLYHSYDTILVYVDNAKWHKSKIIQLYQSLRPRIVLEYIPRYSPDLNPVEWEWHELRRVTTHTKRFQSSDECFQAVSEHFKSRIGKNTMYRQHI
ncbi:MAG: IS630 family transposase [Candidatus Latescibacter sp.]|nr:IS630 family transposase [Candidatus Latescibacter sp.]